MPLVNVTSNVSLPLPFPVTPERDFHFVSDSPKSPSIDCNETADSAHSIMDTSAKLATPSGSVGQTICIPETPPSISHNRTLDLLHTSKDESEHKLEINPHSAHLNRPIFTVDALLDEDEDGEVTIVDEHKSSSHSFNSSSPPLSPISCQSETSQPGLKLFVSEEKQPSKPGQSLDPNNQMDDSLNTNITNSRLRMSETYQSSLIQSRSSSPTRSSLSPTRNDPSSSIATSGLISARSIIELLSDDEDGSDRQRAAIQKIASSSNTAAETLPAMVSLSSSSSELPMATASLSARSMISFSAPISDILSDDDGCIAGASNTDSHSFVHHSAISASSDHSHTTSSSVPLSSPAHWRPASVRRSTPADQTISSTSTIPFMDRTSLEIVKNNLCHVNVGTTQKSRSKPTHSCLPIDSNSSLSPTPAHIVPSLTTNASAHLALTTASLSSPTISPSLTCPFTVGPPSSLLARFGSCCLPPFSEFSLAELKLLMEGFGLKTKSKNQMSNKLQQLWLTLASRKGIDPIAQISPSVISQSSSSTVPKKRNSPSTTQSKKASASVSTDITLESKLDLNASPTVTRVAASDCLVVQSANPILSSSLANPSVSSSSSQSNLPNSSQLSPDLIVSIRTFLRSQTDLYVRILLFQPIDVVELAFLMQDIAGIKVHPSILRSVLDAEGVCTTSWNMAETEDGGNKRRRKPAAHIPRQKQRRR